MVLIDEFLEIYPQFKNDPDRGSDAWMARFWDHVCTDVESMGMGSESRTSRWWSFEECSRLSLFYRLHIILVGCFIGVQRRWWGLTECPLLQVLNDKELRDDHPLLDAEPLPGDPSSGSAAASTFASSTFGRQRYTASFHSRFNLPAVALVAPSFLVVPLT